MESTGITAPLTATILILLFSTIGFVDSVERVATRLGLTRYATGSLLAAGLTALPETLIALVSPLHGSAEALEVGAASVLAAPSITILLGAPIIALFSSSTQISGGGVKRNYLLFAVIFPSAVISSYVLPLSGRYLVSVILMVLYVFLAGRMVLSEGEKLESSGSTFLERLLRTDSMLIVIVQLFASLGGMLYGADIFLGVVSVVEGRTGYALLASPFATCLEEVLVAAVWVARRKADISMSLLSGENLIQSTLVIGLGMVATGWNLPQVGAGISLLYSAAAALYFVLLSVGRARTLAAGLLLYPLYILMAVS